MAGRKGVSALYLAAEPPGFVPGGLGRRAALRLTPERSKDPDAQEVQGVQEVQAGTG